MEERATIRILPELLVNKIAAGEVVERPASVIKELMENSLDAGATRIAVAMEDGGRRLIRVSDDGCGLSAEDLRLAMTPHATSKITAEDDLYAIHTMGFRGEALASIAAVSKLRLASRLPGVVAGHEVRVAADRVESSQAVGCLEGTIVEVRDLFFNVPVRRKFLRSAGTEVGHINEQFARIALAFPSVAFELTKNGRVTQNLPPCENRLERIAKLFGPELAAAMMHITRCERGIELDIFAALPAQSRATTQWQYTFVNRRYVRDKFLQHAVREAYRGLIEPNRHAVVFMFLTVDPADVDVNVHPTKIEVRWADSHLIHSQALSALRETFQQCDLTPMLRTGRAAPPIEPAQQDRLRRDFAETLKSTTPLQCGVGSGASERNASTAWKPSSMPERMGVAAAPSANWSEAAKMWKHLYGEPGSVKPAPLNSTGAHSDRVQRVPAVDPEGFASDARTRPRAIQMHNLYLVAETEDGIVIVDQHALHERVMYEQLRARWADSNGEGLESQRLLLPETVRVTPAQAELLETHASLLEQLGIELTPFGGDAVAVHAFPSLLKDADIVGFMRDLLDLLGQQPGANAVSDAPSHEASTEVVIHKVLDLMACKAAVKAGDPLTAEEIDVLLQKRYLIEKSSSCPHGRPTMLRLTKADLNRQFKRT